MDTTAIGIGLGLVGTLVYGALAAWKHRKFDMQNCVLVFLALFAIPGGIALLWFAFLGLETELPNNWREYIGVAGVVGIGLSADFLVKRFRSLVEKTVSATEQSNDASSCVSDSATPSMERSRPDLE